jgi:hypothetical protein
MIAELLPNTNLSQILPSSQTISYTTSFFEDEMAVFRIVYDKGLTDVFLI